MRHCYVAHLIREYNTNIEYARGEHKKTYFACRTMYLLRHCIFLIVYEPLKLLGWADIN